MTAQGVNLPQIPGLDIAALVRAHGSFSAAVNADPALAWVREAAATFLRDMAAAPVTTISSWTALTQYLRLDMGGLPRERFRVIFLDRKNQLIADEIMGEGTVDHAPAYPREIVRRALELSASALILVHNHPSGDPTPSQADIDMTRQIIDAGRLLRIDVHDHVIVGRADICSLKQIGAI